MNVSYDYVYSSLVAGGVPKEKAKIMTATAKAESGLNTKAVGDSGDSIGLFQVNIPAHKDKLKKWTGSTDRKVWEQWLKVPDNNIYAAKIISGAGSNLHPWTCYNTGAYKSYLNYNPKLLSSGELEKQKNEYEKMLGGAKAGVSTPFGGGKTDLEPVRDLGFTDKIIFSSARVIAYVVLVIILLVLFVKAVPVKDIPMVSKVSKMI